MSSPPRPNRGVPQVPDAPRRNRRQPIRNLNDDYNFFVQEEQPRILQQKKLTVIDVTGRAEEYSVDLETDAVYNLKDDIFTRIGLNKNVIKMALIFNGKELKDDYVTLSAAGIKDGSRLNVIFQMKSGLQGGGGGTRRRRLNKRKTRKN